MLPRKLAQDAPEAERRRWRIIRLDTHAEMPGLILSADTETGVCTISEIVRIAVAEDGSRTEIREARDYDLGPGGFAIIGR
jgi:hypothetical protein